MTEKGIGYQVSGIGYRVSGVRCRVPAPRLRGDKLRGNDRKGFQVGISKFKIGPGLHSVWLLNYLVGAVEDRLGDDEAHGIRGFFVHDHLVFPGGLHGDVGRFTSS